MFLSHRSVFQRTFGSAPVPGPSPGMQPVALQSLSELERASLQELALFWLQERLLVGHLRLDRGTGGTGWDRRDRREGREGMGQEGGEGEGGRGGSCQGGLRLSHSCTTARDDGYGKTFVTHFG